LQQTRHASTSRRKATSKRTRAGAFLSDVRCAMKFTKPALPISAQLAKLKARGLSVTDDKEAEHCLH